MVQTQATTQQATGVGAERASLVDAAISARGRLLPVHPETRRAIREIGRKGGAVGVVLPGGLRIKTRTVGPATVPDGGGNRGVITGFSHRSRQRMICNLQGIDWAQGAAYFVTLTFDDAHGFEHWESWKSDLRLWRQRLQRRYAGRLAGGIWKWELVRRKSGQHIGRLAPHCHVMLFFTDKQGPPMADFRRWMWANWHSRVDVVRARNTGPQKGKLLSYLSKYMGKVWRLTDSEGVAMTDDGRPVDTETGELLGCGRVWGTFGDIPTRTIATLSMTPEAHRQFIERVNAKGQRVGSWYLGAISEKWRGFALLGDGDDLLQELCDGIEGLDVAPEPAAAPIGLDGL